MSPRGVYDRSKDTKAVKKTKGVKVVAAKAAPADKGNVTALPTTANVEERFAILRDNITALASVRSSMSGVDAVAKKTETEILQHVTALTDLRKQVFGLTSEEQEAERLKTELAQLASGGVFAPLPASPFPPAPAS